jgi:hypothetical protein
MISMLCGREGQFTVQVGSSKHMRKENKRLQTNPKQGHKRCPTPKNNVSMDVFADSEKSGKTHPEILRF